MATEGDKVLAAVNALAIITDYWIRAQGALALNQYRRMRGETIAYGEDELNALADEMNAKLSLVWSRKETTDGERG